MPSRWSIRAVTIYIYIYIHKPTIRVSYTPPPFQDPEPDPKRRRVQLQEPIVRQGARRMGAPISWRMGRLAGRNGVSRGKNGPMVIVSRLNGATWDSKWLFLWLK